MSEHTLVKLESVQFPDQFKGVFHRTKDRFMPIVAAARGELRSLDVPSFLRPYYEFAVLERPQPAFMLLPLMYLATAEQHGGITERHRAYLPWYMLAMELCAVVDDTVDRTPARSNFMSYPERFCEASATSMSGFLVAKSLEKTLATAPEVFPLAAQLFESICATETWELYARYPAVDDETLTKFVHSRYDLNTPIIAHSFNSALRLNGRREVGREACWYLAALGQDVDDVVNIAEQREHNGENDDLKLGVASYPLNYTVSVDPEARKLLDRMWTPFREIPVRNRDEFLSGMARCSELTKDEHAELSERVMRVGVPATIDKIAAEVDAAVRASPSEFRATVREVAVSYLDRLRAIDDRACLERFDERLSAVG